jgi:2-polyprenyl-3-methyl-5-hydroxy-6-metoxy-1,4-benzoquinol methylase
MNNTALKEKQFYDVLAQKYDAMIGFNKRFDHEYESMHALLSRYNIRTALDAGAGTGFYSLLMAQSGVQVSALDVSSEMIRHLKANAKKKKLSLNARVGQFSDIRKIFTREYDAVFCLGNSLPHLRTKRELYWSIKNFIHVLKPGGVLILQLLNYDRILKNRERILSVKESDKQIVVRFYDYGKSNILFNVLSLERKGTVWLPAH